MVKVLRASLQPGFLRFDLKLLQDAEVEQVFARPTGENSMKSLHLGERLGSNPPLKEAHKQQMEGFPHGGGLVEIGVSESGVSAFQDLFQDVVLAVKTGRRARHK